MANTYCTASNWGKGFFTHEDRNDFYLSGHPGDVWVVGNNAAGVSWINRVTGTAKTKAEAQAIVDGKIDEAIVAWNALSAEDQARQSKPVKYTLPQELTMATYKGIKGVKVVTKTADPTASEAVGTVWYNSTGDALKYATQGGGVWASGTNYPQTFQEFPGSAGTSTAALSWAGYQQGGSYLNSSYEYDGTTWAANVSMNRAAGAYTQGLGTQTAALSGGYYRTSPAATLTDSEDYNGSAWTTTNPTINALGKRTGCGTVTAGLEAGGDDIGPAAPVATSESYDGTSWANVASLNTARSMAATHNGVLTAAFTIGGASPATNIYANVEEYDGTSWTETTDINTARKTLQGFGTTALALVFAGEPSPTVITAATESWNGTTWTEVADLATARFSGGSTTGTTNTGGLCIGGSLGPPGSSNAVEEWADPSYTIKTVTVS